MRAGARATGNAKTPRSEKDEIAPAPAFLVRLQCRLPVPFRSSPSQHNTEHKMKVPAFDDLGKEQKGNVSRMNACCGPPRVVALVPRSLPTLPCRSAPRQEGRNLPVQQQAEPESQGC